MEIKGSLVRAHLIAEFQKNPHVRKLAFYLLRTSLPESAMYIRNIAKTLDKLDIKYCEEVAENIDDAKNKLMAKVESAEITSIVIARPLFPGKSEQELFDLLPLSKDVDMLSTLAAGYLMRGDMMFLPATSRAVKTILENLKYDLTGKKALVIGRSPSVGTPIFWYLQKSNATVTLAHSRTALVDIKKAALDSDIIVLAAGKCLLTPADIKDHSLIIDCGFHADGTGDLGFIPSNADYTPVPGGVGPVTTIALVANALNLYDRFC